MPSSPCFDEPTHRGHVDNGPRTSRVTPGVVHTCPALETRHPSRTPCVRSSSSINCAERLPEGDDVGSSQLVRTRSIGSLGGPFVLDASPPNSAGASKLRAPSSASPSFCVRARAFVQLRIERLRTVRATRTAETYARRALVGKGTFADYGCRRSLIPLVKGHVRLVVVEEIDDRRRALAQHDLADHGHV
jgi:hypothetical protein